VAEGVPDAQILGGFQNELFNDVFASGERVWLGGLGFVPALKLVGELRTWNGAAWSATIAPLGLTSVWGTSDGDTWAIASDLDGGRVLLRKPR
jgi:hypothetical protein